MNVNHAPMTVDEYVRDKTAGIVQSGPFAGMVLSPETSWTDGAFSPMLLGCHEEELHGVIERQVARLRQINEPHIVNIGCAEGYYAVGLARRLPRAKVWIIDKSDKALQIAQKNAAANNVQLLVGEDGFESPDLVISDCEGGEVHYLDPARFPGLLAAHMIVELHGTDGALVQRWRDVHHIVVYREGPRDPNRFSMLLDQTSAFRWAAVCENRPCMMAWFEMWPR